VLEETGLRVAAWSERVYRVSVDFPDREMRLGVEVFRAESWSGDLWFDDPDGIVEEGRFVDASEAPSLLGTAPAWVRVPVGDWLHGTGVDDHYDFLAMGLRPGELVVERR
jgi:hypothetical protein